MKASDRLIGAFDKVQRAYCARDTDKIVKGLINDCLGDKICVIDLMSEDVDALLAGKLLVLKTDREARIIVLRSIH